MGFAEQALFASIIFIVPAALFQTGLWCPFGCSPWGVCTRYCFIFLLLFCYWLWCMEAFRFRTTSASNPASDRSFIATFSQSASCWCLVGGGYGYHGPVLSLKKMGIAGRYCMAQMVGSRYLFCGFLLVLGPEQGLVHCPNGSGWGGGHGAVL